MKFAIFDSFLIKLGEKLGYGYGSLTTKLGMHRGAHTSSETTVRTPFPWNKNLLVFLWSSILARIPYARQRLYAHADWLRVQGVAHLSCPSLDT